jgi:hypothetical protein
MSKMQDELMAEIAALKAINQKMKDDADKAARAKVSLKVSEKKAVSLYGLGRFPVTLYEEQWKTLLGMADTISTFLKEQAAAGNLQTAEEKVKAKEAAKLAAKAKAAQAPTL